MLQTINQKIRRMMNRLLAVVALVCATTVSLMAQGLVPEWYTKGDNYFKPVEQFTENNFTMAVMVTIDEVRCDSAYEIGVFCGDECRLSAPLYASKDLFDYFYFYSTLTVNGTSGENFSFRLYDHRNKAEVVSEVCPDEVEFVSNKHYGSFNTGLYELAFVKSTSHRTSLELDDATDLPFAGKLYSITSDGMVCSYTREVSLDGGYESLVLPFDADITGLREAGFEFECFADHVGDTIRFVDLAAGERLQAGVPYIFRYGGTPSNEVKELLITAKVQQASDKIRPVQGWGGTFARMAADSLVDKHVLHVEGNKMVAPEPDTDFPPYHCFMQLPVGTDASALIILHCESIVGIGQVQMQPTADVMYDLSGRRLYRLPQRGIVIVNNKKIYIP